MRCVHNAVRQPLQLCNGHFRAAPIFRQKKYISSFINIDQEQDDNFRSTEAMHEPAHNARRKSSVATNASGMGDFLIGLSIRRHSTGYALLRFMDMLPLQFGVINVKDAVDVQQKALEIGAMLRELRRMAPEKLQQATSDSPITETKSWSWVVSIDDFTVDRTPPRSSTAAGNQQQASMLQGIVMSDCKRIFKIAPTLINPRESRFHLGFRGGREGARQETYDFASSQIDDFPKLLHRSGAIKEDSFLMSDAWASARYLRRSLLVAAKRADQNLVNKLRSQALASKKFQRLTAAIDELQPRRSAHELTHVLETRLEKFVEDRIAQLVDEEFGLRRDK